MFEIQILVCRPEEVKRITGIVKSDCPALQSCLSEDKNGMTHAIMEVVAGGIVQTASDIHRYVRCTLLNSTKPFDDVVKSAQDSLRWLCHKRFVEWNNETKIYSTTPLGRASFGSSLNPEESLVGYFFLLYFLYFSLNVSTNHYFSLQVVLDDLSRAREGFVLASDLHLVYLVTPINVEVEPDWELYYERFMQLSTLEQVHMCSVASTNLLPNIWVDLLYCYRVMLVFVGKMARIFRSAQIVIVSLVKFLSLLLPEMLNAYTLYHCTTEVIKRFYSCGTSIFIQMFITFDLDHKILRKVHIAKPKFNYITY
jgi:hypothetical protein